MGFLLKLRKILGKIADVFIKGREAGLWDKGQGPDFKSKDDIK
jgi:hypothetical protein